MNITLYKSATCPQCKVVKMKLEKKGIPFTEEMDISVMENRGVRGIPTLEVDGELITNLRDINNWVNAQEARI
jgi:glutaredoxin